SASGVCCTKRPGRWNVQLGETAGCFLALLRLFSLRPADRLLLPDGSSAHVASDMPITESECGLWGHIQSLGASKTFSDCS
ncbi:MAG: hypothetical protein CL819_03310, partial [Croceicoccus sp.]|nr:hypothetical protein [Croceicoccus sp.]